jgi:hypothetical protein
MDQDTKDAILNLLQIIEDLKEQLSQQGLIKLEVGESVHGKTLLEPVAHKGGKVVEALTAEELFTE